MGSGRVDALASAKAVSVADPGSLSYGLEFAQRLEREVQSFTVTNIGRPVAQLLGQGRHAALLRLRDRPGPREGLARPAPRSRARRRSRWRPGRRTSVSVELTLNPRQIAEDEQEYGRYAFHPNVDGNISIHQNGAGGEPADDFHVPWHVAPLAASANSLSKSSLDLNGGPQTMTLKNNPSAGIPQADLYLLGATDPQESLGGGGPRRGRRSLVHRR